MFFEPNGDLSINKHSGDVIKQFLKEENQSLDLFQCCIDYHDIVSVQKLRGINQSSDFIDEFAVKKNYLYDYYVQLNVSRINGSSLQQILANDIEPGFENDNYILSLKKKEPAIASVFFRFSHRDSKGNILPNNTQCKIVEQIVNAIKEKVIVRRKQPREQSRSGTFLRFFDLIEHNINQTQKRFESIMGISPSFQQVITEQTNEFEMHFDRDSKPYFTDEK